MRLLITIGAMLLALALPITANAKPPSGGGGMSWGGSSSGWHPGFGYYHGNGYPGYGYYGNGYYVQRPIVDNLLPAANFSGDPIRIVNPSDTRVALSYVLNGAVYTIRPGESQNLREDRAWVIEFGRGGSFGQARYGLLPGVYTFALTGRGWELYRQPLSAPDAVAAPPPSGVPDNALPSR
jgi:hypothetical protein